MESPRWMDLKNKYFIGSNTYYIIVTQLHNGLHVKIMKRDGRRSGARGCETCAAAVHRLTSTSRIYGMILYLGNRSTLSGGIGMTSYRGRSHEKPAATGGKAVDYAGGTATLDYPGGPDRVTGRWRDRGAGTRRRTPCQSSLHRRRSARWRTVGVQPDEPGGGSSWMTHCRTLIPAITTIEQTTKYSHIF